MRPYERTHGYPKTRRHDRRQKAERAPAATQTGSYKHTEPKALLRPEIGVQNYAASQGKFKRGPTKYRYDDSLAPELAWDSQNPARERGEALIARGPLLDIPSRNSPTVVFLRSFTPL